MEKLFQNESIIVAKDDLMVSPTGSKPTFRKAHFVKPIVSSKDSDFFKLPYLKPKKKWPLQISFNGWSDGPVKKWKGWVRNMRLKYGLVWEKAGVLEAIMVSTLRIKKNEAFLLSFVENWCSETNSFTFPWGEVTVTLEDVLVLGGYSVLGDPVLTEYERDDELVEIREFLEDGRKKGGSLGGVEWLYRFMDCGCVYEHEAFLCLWLLTCVFPGADDRVFGIVVDLAVWLGRGRRFALGACVLASLYRDLGVLKGAMVELDDCDGLAFTLWSPLYLVQVWAWERFPLLQPKPNVIRRGDVRMKRWHGEKNGSRSVNGNDVSSGELAFLWRPYAIAVEGCSLPKFYVEKEVLLRHGELSLEFESFFRCLRACLLVGVDCQEQYNPHRVAMQFGLDQDIPGKIPREHVSSEIGWYDYNKPLSDDEILYVPSRLFESDVSDAYSKWWRKRVLCPVSPFKGVLTGLRSCRKRREFTLSYRKQGHYADVFQDFVLKVKSSINRCEIGIPNPENNLDIPPGFEQVDAAYNGSLKDFVVKAEPIEVANKFAGIAKEGFISAESADDVPPGFRQSHASRFRSLNDLVSEAKSNEVVDDAPPGFRHVHTAKEGSTSKKSVDDAPSGFGSLTKSTARKRKEKSLLAFPLKQNKLVITDEKSRRRVNTESEPNFEFRRSAPANPKQIVGSITGEDYRNVILNKGGSGTHESKRLANGSSSNFDVERVSNEEVLVSRLEGEVAALKGCKRRKTSDVSDIEARVASIRMRVSKIEQELAAMRNGEDI